VSHLSATEKRLGLRVGTWFAAGVVLVLAWGLSLPAWLRAEEARPPANSAGNGAAKDLAKQYIDLYADRERLAAGNEFLKEEIERLSKLGDAGAAGRVLLDPMSRTDPESRSALGQLLQQGSEPVVEDLNDASAELAQRVEEMKASWLSVRGSLNRERFLLFEVQGSGRVAGQFASLLSFDKRWFWLFGLVAVATLAGIVFHDRRREVRRMLNGGRARAMGLSKLLTAAAVVLAMLTLVTFLMGNSIYEALLTVGSGEQGSPRGAIEAQNAAISREIESLQKERQALLVRHEQALDARRRELTDALPARNRLPLRWKQYRQKLLEASESLALLERVPAAIEADQKELARLGAELSAQADATARYLRLRYWIRGGLGLVLLALAACTGYFFRRGVEIRRDITANTCPLCLGLDCLEPVEQPGAEGDDPPRAEAVECTNVISEDPHEECGYTFMDVYRPMPKICFPTLGVPQAGKTHWLAMLYWELNRGNYPRSVLFEKIKSRSSEDFDLVVEEILRSRIGTAATQRDRIPHPLVFNFRDRDLWGRSDVLVNIFDYSGEVTLDMGVEDYRRRRALDGDGYFFFLDPTYPSEPQAQALAAFREDLRVVKGLRAGRRLRTPVALCVSKIDLLASQSYALPDGGDAIARFYDDLEKIDPSGEAMTLEVMEARSRLIAQLRDTIWPGWQIERQIDDLFGGRYLFFPLTPVGLDGSGESDLSLRTISPFGLLEPLLWLLEMNGYPVMK